MVFEVPDNIYDTETGLGMHLIHDFFYALSFNGRFNLHIHLVRGKNPHHIIEAMFKGTAIALRKALEITQDDHLALKACSDTKLMNLIKEKIETLCLFGVYTFYPKAFASSLCPL